VDAERLVLVAARQVLLDLNIGNSGGPPPVDAPEFPAGVK
jgi:hypothetical protein